MPGSAVFDSAPKCKRIPGRKARRSSPCQSLFLRGLVVLGQDRVGHGRSGGDEDTQTHDYVRHRKDLARSGFRRKVAKTHCRDRHYGKIDGVQPAPPLDKMVEHGRPKDHSDGEGEYAFHSAVLESDTYPTRYSGQ